MARITGTTRVFHCLADPIDQVRAPEVFNAVFARSGTDAVMVPLRVPAHGLEGALRALLASPGSGGVALSIPHKAAAAALVDRRSATAAASGAVNAVRRGPAGELEGDLFDGDGFMGLLARAGIAWAGRRVLIVGAGGAASAVAVALARAGAAAIALVDPDASRAQGLAARLKDGFGVDAWAAASNDPRGFDLVVNASPLGLGADDPMPVAVERLDGHAAVCDILMKNQPTPLVRAALARGLVAEPGFDMLVRQVPRYLDFFGYPALAESVARDDGFLRELLFPPGMARERRPSGVPA